MKLTLLLIAALLLPGCAYWDLWFVVPKPPPMEGTLKPD